MSKIFYKSAWLILVSLLMLSCETKEDKLCRDQLSSTIRQINAIYQGFADNKSAEESLNLLGIRDYYSNYTNQLIELRKELAKQKITKRFIYFNKLINQIISYGIDYFNDRQELMLQLYELNSAFSSFKSYSDQYREYVRKSITSTYSFDYYSDLSDEYLKKAENAQEELKEGYEIFLNLSNKSIEVKNTLIINSDSLNLMRTELKILDSLFVKSILNDTTDFINQIIVQIEDLQKLIE